MFGGLELKGGGCGGASKKEETPCGPAAPSAFGFLLSAPTPSAPESVVSSAFSFLASTPTSAAVDVAPGTAAPMSSAFSFLNTTTGRTTGSTHEDTGADASAAVPAPPTPATPVGSSSFSFLSSMNGGGDSSGGIPSPTTSGTVETSSFSNRTAAAVAPLSSSGFSFLSSTSEAPVPSAPLESAPAAVVTAPPLPAGAGQTFASPPVAVGGTKKRRTRTTAIGAAAQQQQQQQSSHVTTTTTTTNPMTPRSAAAAPPSTSDDPSSVREQAAQANQRAEEIMRRLASSSPQQPSPHHQQKAGEPSQSKYTSSVPKHVPLKTAHTAATMTKPPMVPRGAAAGDDHGDDSHHHDDENNGENDDDDDDAILQQARAAAEEAQKQNAKQHRSWLGGLMRTGSRGGGGGTGPKKIGSTKTTISSGSASVGSNNSNSQHGTGKISPVPHGSSNSTINHRNSPPIEVQVTTTTLHDDQQEPEDTPLQRLQREQEEVQRRMIETQKQRLQLLQQEETTTSPDSSYQPLDLAPSSYRPVSVIPVPEPPAKTNTQSSAFSSFLNNRTTTKTQLTPVPLDITNNKPKTNTPRDQLDAMIKEFRSKVQLSMEQVKQLRQQKIIMFDERFQATANERLAASKIQQAEAQQTAAVEQEDFDLADRMTTVIEKVKAERLEHQRAVQHINQALQHLQRQKQALAHIVTQSFVDIQESLQTFSKQQEQDATTSQDGKETIMAQFEKVSKQISAEQERLQQDWKHLERDTKLVQQERQELETAISQQAGVHERQRDEARQKVKTIEQEMEELRQLLQAKQEQVARLRTEAAGHDEAVLKVRVKFSRQLGRVQHKEMTLEDNREEWDNENAALQRQKQAHEAVVAQHHKALLERDTLAQVLKTEVEMAETFQSIVAKEVGNLDDDDDAQATDSSESTTNATDDETLVTCQAAVTEAKEVLQAAEASLQALKEEQEAIQTRLPILEHTKTTAAAKRDFKAAGKASKEIKELLSRLVDLDATEMVQAQQRLNKAMTALEHHQALLQEEMAKAQEREQATAVARMKTLAEHMVRLQATQKSACNPGKEESHIQGVGALVLQSQMEALRLQGETYNQKYGGWEELLQQVGFISSQSEQEQQDTETPLTSSEADKDETTEPETSNAVASEEEEQQQVDAQPNEEEEAKKKESAMKEFRRLTARLEQVNMDIEMAAAQENYDKAAELDEIMQKLLEEVQLLGLSDDEMAQALAVSDENEDQAPVADEAPAAPKEKIIPSEYKMPEEATAASEPAEELPLSSEEAAEEKNPSGQGEAEEPAEEKNPSGQEEAEEPTKDAVEEEPGRDTKESQEEEENVHKDEEKETDEKKEAGAEDETTPRPIKNQEMQHEVTTTT